MSKIAVVTGGGSGIGKATALALARNGYTVSVAGRRQEPLDETVAEIEKAGSTGLGVQTDVGKPDAVEALFSKVREAYGRLDLLFNNAGFGTAPLLEDLTYEEWQGVVDTNLTGSFLCTQQAFRIMKDQSPQGGRIINIGSVNSFVATKGIGGRHYEAAKAAVVNFTRATAVDWALHDITVNAICPGGFMTEPNQRWADEQPEVIEKFKSQVPLEKFGEPEDLGPLAVYLASDAARYVTGAAILIDGGYTVW